MPTDHSSALALSATIVLTVLASAAAAQQGGADQSSPPPPPAWVDADGKVKPESAPREVPMVGREGKLLKDDKGYDKMVPSHIGETPPPPMRAAAQQGGADQGSPPPAPTWVDADGKVKMDSAPREVPMVGREGKLLKDEKGYDKMVPSHIGETPPAPLR